jgi:hypothetical protein
LAIGADTCEKEVEVLAKVESDVVSIILEVLKGISVFAILRIAVVLTHNRLRNTITVLDIRPALVV